MQFSGLILVSLYTVCVTLQFDLAVCFRLEVPTRDWHCPNCTKNIGHGGRDPSPVNLHPHQVVMQPVYQPGDCVICRFVYAVAVS